MGTIEYGPLAKLMSDPSVTEIMVNGYDDIWVERGGKLQPTELQFTSETALLVMISQIAAYVGRRISPEEAMLDARLPDGSRVNVILPPLSLSGAVVTIRRFAKDVMSASDLIRSGSATAAALDFLCGCVLAKRSILISGRTGTGKTTLLNILSAWVPAGERIITIEDAAELQLRQPHWIRLESRPADGDGRNGVPIRALLRNSLRMRPDRIVVGEVRGGEALDMLQAMSTGHEGSLGTIHANNPRDALQRLETLMLMAGLEMPQAAARDQIASALNVIVHVDRTDTGQRRIDRIAEIVGREGDKVTMQDVFVVERRTEHGPKADRLVPTGIRPRSLDSMVTVRDDLPPGLLRVFPDPRLAA
jgi:pilus assembly protein CpaF